ncbi:Crp/Fnr family transcriptional regulator [Deminuibacter soli]|uniref:Crp/Fnr family transcriptional regulator n=1 Tax=Deminuibacter soli TaxID=2291815 RepID=A0A3E1NK04_9BACT|nr:Crp/Fnr family transcriptional regulator [Deminuibacter soli]RFM28259.1 Crp/Fnr family transcriptional regulator [Deminuibacter soli]
MKQNKAGCDLKSCFLCQLCQPEWNPAIAAYRKTLSYKKGEVIFKEGDLVKGIFFVYNGIVKVHKQWGTEKELIIRFARQGDVFGHRGFGKETYYPISATALEPLTVCYIDIPFFLTTLKMNYDFIFKLMSFYAAELQESERNMRNLAHMPVKGRIVNALLRLQEKFGVTSEGFIGITLSRQDLASYAGTTYETVFRIINEFVEDNLIKLSGKDIGIVNMPKLEQLIEEQP